MYNQCTLNVTLYYGSKIIIFLENLLLGLTGSGAENSFHSILPVTQLYSLVYEHFILFDRLNLKKASKLMFMSLFYYRILLDMYFSFDLPRNKFSKKNHF